MDEDLDNYHLKELRCSTQCHTQMSMWIISRGVVLLILLMEYKVLKDSFLHRSSINNYASLSNKFGGFYFSFKFGISGLLHQVITTIADRIRVLFLEFEEDHCLLQILTKIEVEQPQEVLMDFALLAIPLSSDNINFLLIPAQNVPYNFDMKMVLSMAIHISIRCFHSFNNNIISSQYHKKQEKRFLIRLKVFLFSGVIQIPSLLMGPDSMLFFSPPPFGFVSMYRRKRDLYCEYLPGPSIGGRSFKPAAMILLCI
ncbi:hypothetical protein Tco_1009805 [Tanacetum coccineum]